MIMKMICECGDRVSSWNFKLGQPCGLCEGEVRVANAR